MHRIVFLLKLITVFASAVNSADTPEDYFPQ